MKTTSRLYDDLYKLLGQSDWVDRRHLQTLVWMLVGRLCSGCVSLTRWTAYIINSRATRAQSYQRRLSRWLHNPRLNTARLYSQLIKQALSRWESPFIVLILDTSLLLFRLICSQN